MIFLLVQYVYYIIVEFTQQSWRVSIRYPRCASLSIDLTSMLSQTICRAVHQWSDDIKRDIDINIDIHAYSAQYEEESSCTFLPHRLEHYLSKFIRHYLHHPSDLALSSSVSLHHLTCVSYCFALSRDHWSGQGTERGLSLLRGSAATDECSAV